jgi:hypothetical protein
MPSPPRSYLKQNRERTAMQLLKHGAILFRGRSCSDLNVTVLYCGNTLWRGMLRAGERPHTSQGFPWRRRSTSQQWSK